MPSTKAETDLELRSTDFDSPYAAGFDAGLNGSDTANTHFRWFSTRPRMEEWTRGKTDGENTRDRGN